MLEFLAISAGLFYLVGGLYLLWAMRLDGWADAVLEALDAPDARAEKRRTMLLRLGGGLTVISGLSLATLSPLSPLVLGAGALAYSCYLVWSARHLPPQDAEEARGRRSTVNAYIVYLAVTALTFFLQAAGSWRALLVPGDPAPGAAIELATMVGLGGLAVWASARGGPSPEWLASSSASMPEPGQDAPMDEVLVDGRARTVEGATRPTKLRLTPEYQCWPTWDHDEGLPVDPVNLGLSDALVERIKAWDDRFQAIWDHEDPFGCWFEDVEAEIVWAEEGKAIAAVLGREWPGLFVDNLSGLRQMLASHSAGLPRGQSIPLERAPDIARSCGLLEIEEVFVRLDRLAREKLALPQWDGDSSDDISEGQHFFAQVLAHVPDRYRDRVSELCRSADPETRRWVDVALENPVSVRSR
ncbi:hypothetical protein [Pelagibacterium montanilacus]|uniref:hypothetical protein n=1 Tax=Pelagibacterium montanilacus TaxID=2185280 RepID=UPI000F8D1BDA|nr:hypothetical protein [Pelagibacterium montanilacus]